MKIVFCNHPQSDAGSNQLRIHAGATSAFNHWGGDQGVARGECSFNLGYPEDVQATAVNNTPGNNLYNHNGPQNNSRIFISVNSGPSFSLNYRYNRSEIFYLVRN